MRCTNCGTCLPEVHKQKTALIDFHTKLQQIISTTTLPMHLIRVSLYKMSLADGTKLSDSDIESLAKI